MGISREQALDCFRSDDLIGIGMEADAARRSLHPDGIVTYGIDACIELSLHLAEAGSFSLHTVQPEVAAAVDLGATGLSLEGAPRVTIAGVESLLSFLKQEFPDIRLHGLAASAVLDIAEISGLTLEVVLCRLYGAGLDSISADGLEAIDWLRIHRAAHAAGMRTNATFLFGAGETPDERVAQLEAIRALQAETGGFAALLAATIPQRDLAAGLEEATAVEYLKTLAIARMFLDNIENVQASLHTQGLKVLQMGLRFGSNDIGSVLVQGEAQRGAGLSLGATEEEIRRLVRDAGFTPVSRDPLFRTMFLN